ncbi:MAG: bis-aminopropyl spermidine synthase family protein [bacterium]|nr:bis-aminopropyl spermidine synthase family protein [bacterium]
MSELINDQALEERANKLELRQADILAFLQIVSEKGMIKNQELVMLTGLPKTHLGRLLNSYASILEPPSENVVLKTDVSEVLEAYLKDAPESRAELELYESMISLLDNYRDDRPEPNRHYDQFTATLDTSVRRALRMRQEGDLRGRDVLFLGDNDLTSVTTALLREANSVTVLEIDERIIALINKISEDNGLSINIVQRDLRETLLKEHKAKYDVVFTDPPYTESGIGLFVNQGIKSLRPKLSSRIYVCYGNSIRARERELRIQNLFIGKGLLMHSVLFQFNKYYEAQSIGSSSSLYSLDWTPKTKPEKKTPELKYTNQR